jgi:radical SAM superfamily enzyme YgiQ (UPF0313 family)
MDNASGRDDTGVLLINPPYQRRIGGSLVPPIGLAYLAGALKREGANIAILDLAAELPDFQLTDSNSASVVLNAAMGELPFRPILVGIGPLVTANLEPTRHIVSNLRRISGLTIVVGGPLTVAPDFGKVADEYLDVDATVVGDGETPIARIWQTFEEHQPELASVRWRGGPDVSPHREQDLVSCD